MAKLPERRRNFYVANTKVTNEQACCTHGYRLLLSEEYDAYAVHCHPHEADGYAGGCVSPTMTQPEGEVDPSQRYCYVVTLTADGESTNKEPLVPTATYPITDVIDQVNVNTWHQ
jgi:hypothetical protein